MSSEPTADEIDILARRIATAIERYLPDYGFQPYCYPSGENKSVDYLEPGVITVYEATGTVYQVRVSAVSPFDIAASSVVTGEDTK